MTMFHVLHRMWEKCPAGLRRSAENTPTLRTMKRQIVRMLQTHDDVYDAKYYEFVDRRAVQSAGVIADSIVTEFAPRTTLDVGCGTGALLHALRERNVKVTGLEYSEAGLKYCHQRQLDVRRFDLELDRALLIDTDYDVVVSTEVAEHLPERLADPFVSLLATRAGSAVVFTAATPGQGGVDHVNEQPHQYWISKFEERGWRYDEASSLEWRANWEARAVAWWYSRNLMLFRRS